MRLAIDALGANGFPRAALAEAVHASFTATSYVGPEPTPHSRYLFKHYLEAVLGLMDLESGATTSWPTQQPSQGGNASNSRRPDEAAHHQGAFGEAHPTTQQAAASSRRGQWQDRLPPVVSAASPPSLLSGTALLCLVCAYMQPPQASLANRAAKTCANHLGMIVAPHQLNSDGAAQLCDNVAETLLQESLHMGDFSLHVGSSPKPIVSSSSSAARGTVPMEFVEASVWLLRSCGKHERAMQILYERMQQQQQFSQSHGSSSSSHLGWSQIKYDSYTATHLSELWGSGRDEGCNLVLQSKATRRLLERNPRLGLSAFTALHPQNPAQWKALNINDDPLAHPTYPRQVLQLLQSVQPVIPYGSSGNDRLTSLTNPSLLSASEDIDVTPKSTVDEDDRGNSNLTVLPLESGRALAVTFLESALGIASGRPLEGDEFDVLPLEEGFLERMADFHDELAFLLLEGVIAERGDNGPEAGESKSSTEDDTPLGRIYRRKLRRLLRWPLCKVRSDRFLSALPPSFLQERAFVLGNLGRHEEALKIFFRDLKRIDLALEYCDARHEQIQAKREREKARRQQQGGGFFDDLVISEQEQRYFDSYDKNAPGNTTDCAYIPLVRVALESSETPQEGTAAAIQVLALRRSVMDWGAALRLLPKDVPVSAVARPFLIPALVESESQVRRLAVVSSLLRSRYSSLKQQLTTAQLKAQENIHVVPQLKSLRLGNPLHSTKPLAARPSSSASPTFPDVMIIKHFFPRHLVIQAKVKHTLEGRSLGDVTFVVAESSEEAIQPSLKVPLKVLPYNVQGSTWCVLSASPQRMDSLAILTCELRYTVLDAEGTSGFASAESVSSVGGRTYVEELQDLEVYATHFQ
jgi:Vam6/Vps39-like protein vacuolar protein sorting-associated protein 39